MINNGSNTPSNILCSFSAPYYTPGGVVSGVLYIPHASYSNRQILVSASSISKVKPELVKKATSHTFISNQFHHTNMIAELPVTLPTCPDAATGLYAVPFSLTLPEKLPTTTKFTSTYITRMYNQSTRNSIVVKNIDGTPLQTFPFSVVPYAPTSTVSNNHTEQKNLGGILSSSNPCTARITASSATVYPGQSLDVQVDLLNDGSNGLRKVKLELVRCDRSLAGMYTTTLFSTNLPNVLPMSGASHKIQIPAFAIPQTNATSLGGITSSFAVQLTAKTSSCVIIGRKTLTASLPIYVLPTPTVSQALPAGHHTLINMPQINIPVTFQSANLKFYARTHRPKYDITKPTRIAPLGTFPAALPTTVIFTPDANTTAAQIHADQRSAFDLMMRNSTSTSKPKELSLLQDGLTTTLSSFGEVLKKVTTSPTGSPRPTVGVPNCSTTYIVYQNPTIPEVSAPPASAPPQFQPETAYPTLATPAYAPQVPAYGAQPQPQVYSNNNRQSY